MLERHSVRKFRSFGRATERFSNVSSICGWYVFIDFWATWCFLVAWPSKLIVPKLVPTAHAQGHATHGTRMVTGHARGHSISVAIATGPSMCSVPDFRFPKGNASIRGHENCRIDLEGRHITDPLPTARTLCPRADSRQRAMSPG